MTWILTADACALDLAAPNPACIKPFGIAWALSQINRFNGHCLRPYSVAEHSLLVAEIAERELGLDVHGQLAALLHDAHEAFVGDLSSPAKRVIGEPWAQFEGRIEHATHTAFGLHSAATLHAAAIKRADLMALATERRDLLPGPDYGAGALPWPVLDGIEPIGWVRLYTTERIGMDWEAWRDAWLDRYHELDHARQDALDFAA